MSFWNYPFHKNRTIFHEVLENFVFSSTRYVLKETARRRFRRCHWGFWTSVTCGSQCLRCDRNRCAYSRIVWECPRLAEADKNKRMRTLRYCKELNFPFPFLSRLLPVYHCFSGRWYSISLSDPNILHHGWKSMFMSYPNIRPATLYRGSWQRPMNKRKMGHRNLSGCQERINFYRVTTGGLDTA